MFGPLIPGTNWMRLGSVSSDGIGRVCQPAGRPNTSYPSSRRMAASSAGRLLATMWLVAISR